MVKKKHAPRGYRSPGTGGGGRSAGPAGSNQMINQLQQLQEQMEAAQAALADETVEGSAGGGVVTVVVSGQQELRSITIKPEVVDPEEVEMLQDLILSAVNQAIAQSRDLAGARMGGLTQGLALPPGLL